MTVDCNTVARIGKKNYKVCKKQESGIEIISTI
jgi:hypothetical protein